MKNKININSGFTLVELAIVIVIIGILIVAMISGDDLLNNSRLSATISDMRKLATAYHSFDEKYNGAPGDLRDANDYFSSSDVNNGTGDGFIHYMATVTSANSETYNAFIMLRLAGIYTETSNTNEDYLYAVSRGNAGVVVPKSKGFKDCVLMLAQAATKTASSMSSKPRKNAIFVVSPNPRYNVSSAGGPLHRGCLSPYYAEAIDKKLDNGLASSGTVRDFRGDRRCGTDWDRYRACEDNNTAPQPDLYSEKDRENKIKFPIYWTLD